jgi:hypothetical protein
MTRYSVKAVKTFHGHDGYGWECKLYADKTFIAFVVEDGWGGELQFHWQDECRPGEGEKVDVVAHNLLDQKRVTYKGTPFEAALALHCETLPKWKCNDKMIHTDPEIFVNNLVNTKLAEKEVKKITKKAAVLNGKDIITWRCDISHSQIRDIIKKEYPDGIILNDLPLEKAVALYEGLQGG